MKGIDLLDSYKEYINSGERYTILCGRCRAEKPKIEEHRREKMKNKIYISCLLKDNMIVCYHISRNKREFPHDYYKDFYYAGISMENCDELYEVKWCSVEIDEDINHNEFNRYIFEDLARKFYRNWKIHPEHWGSAAY